MSVDDLTGRRVGAQCGRAAWSLAERYFEGTIVQAPVTLTLQPANSDQCELRFNTLRGFFYKLQSSPDLAQPFIDDSAGYVQAIDSSIMRIDNVAGPRKFYRVVSTLAP